MRKLKKLKLSTINQYSVIQLTKHIERFQLSHDIDYYRFDYAYKNIYRKCDELNIYIFIASIHNYNRDRILHILYDVYSIIMY